MHNEAHRIFIDQLFDAYRIERQALLNLIGGQPESASKRDAETFEYKLRLQRARVVRLEEVFELFEMTPKDVAPETPEVISAVPARQATKTSSKTKLLLKAKKEQSNEDAVSYRYLANFARELGYDNAAYLLRENLA